MLTRPADLRQGEDTLLTLFERTACAHPSRIALRSRTTQLSYQEFDAASNRLAHALLERGGALGDRVVILMQHDLPQIVVALAILKAGRIVVALNPTHPPARLRQLIDDAEPAAIVTDHATQALAVEATGDHGQLIVYDGQFYDDQAGDGATHRPSISVSAGQGAALTYTSGSTGQPKAVIQTHRQSVRNVAIHTEAMAYSTDDRIPLFASISGGQGIMTVFCALANGATLCPFPVAVAGVTGLAAWMADLGITIYVSSASIFRTFMKTIEPGYVFDGVRAVRLSSEPATSDDFRLFQRHFSRNSVFVHTLSSSETCNIAWSRRLHQDTVPEGRLPIGLPSRGQEVLLLDEAGTPVPPGEVGEITVKSRYVAAGYWRNEALTAERFGPDLDGRGTHMVRTGDLGRINSDGLLEFIGRQDDRIKIRGNRVALFEIEAALQQLDGVRRAAVEAIARDSEEALLVAFAVLAPEHACSPTTLRRALRQVLPDHMVPARIVLMDTLPITPTGKIDREALRGLAPSRKALSAADSPQTEMERFLAELWESALAVSNIARSDNFFDLGGDSLIAAVMSARIHEAFGLELELATFFDFPVLSELAEHANALHPTAMRGTPAVHARARPGVLPLTYNQESLWTLSQSKAGALTGCRCSRIAGPLDSAALARCIDAMIARHEMLRTTFAKNGDGLVQIVHPAMARTPLQYHDFSGDADAEIKARQVWKAEQAQVFDLASLPIVSFTLIRLRHEEHWLIYTAHAILLDGLCWSIFFRELSELYELHAQGRDLLLRASAPQYGDYAVWQRETLHPDSSRYRELLRWWRDDILDASYPHHPRYRTAMSWCMNVMERAPRPLKQAIGAGLRSAMRPPLPPRCELPFKRAVAADEIDASEGLINWGVSSEASRRLEALARDQSASHYVTRLAAYVAMLASETGDPNVVLYTPLSNRGRPETRDVFGCCATSAIVMLHCNPQRTFRQHLRIVRDRLRAMQLHADIPYDRIHRDMRAWKIKMPQGRAILSTAWTHAPIHCGGIEITSLPDRHLAAAPLAFDVKFDTADETRNCSVLFDAVHYDPEKVRGFINRFAALLDAVARDPDMRVNDAMRAVERG